MTRYRHFVLGLVLAAAGCSPSELAHPSDVMRHELLPTLEAGESTRDDVIAELGPPAAEFESGRIAVYRMAESGGHGLVVAAREGLRGWKGAQFSLILVYREAGVLERISLVRVKGPVER